MKVFAKELIKIMLENENYKQKDLAIELTKITGHTYTPNSLAQKIRRGTISYNEVVIIADILGYSLIASKNKKIIL